MQCERRKRAFRQCTPLKRSYGCTKLDGRALEVVGGGRSYRNVMHPKPNYSYLLQMRRALAFAFLALVLTACQAEEYTDSADTETGDPLLDLIETLVTPPPLFSILPTYPSQHTIRTP